MEGSIDDDSQDPRDKRLPADVIIYSVPIYRVGIRVRFRNLTIGWVSILRRSAERQKIKGGDGNIQQSNIDISMIYLDKDNPGGGLR
jgi:hypothetical protein